MNTEPTVDKLTAPELLVALAKKLGVDNSKLLDLLASADNFELLDFRGKILAAIEGAAKGSATRVPVLIDYDQTLTDVVTASDFVDKWVHMELDKIPVLSLIGQQELEVIEFRFGQTIYTVKLLDVLRERGLVFADALTAFAYAQQYAERWKGGIAVVFTTTDGHLGSIMFVGVEEQKRVLITYNHNEVFDEDYTFLVLKQGVTA